MGQGRGGFFSDKESPCGASVWGALGGWLVVLISAFYQEKMMAYLWRK